MQSINSDPDLIAKRAMELMGGREKFFEESDKELREVNDQWNQNVSVIGKILRAHLFVEHFLTRYLAETNPRLGSMTEARLSFTQKLALLDISDESVRQILPGLKRLNSIRNRLAHNLNSHVTDDDAKIFLDCEQFSAMRSVKAKTEQVGTTPLEVLEEFARFTSTVFLFEFSPLGQAIAQAIKEIRNSQ